MTPRALPTARSAPTRRHVAVLALTGLLMSACGGDDAASAVTAPESTAPVTTVASETAPRVVASTSWVAAFAVAAGIDDVTIVAPANLQHPPDYDPRPSDLAAVADADFVLLAGFEGFAERLTEATGSAAELIRVNAENTPDNVRAEVRALAETFGTTDAADVWITEFDGRIADLQDQIDAARPDVAPTAVAHVFMAYWADFAGIEVVGTWGPAPLSPTQLAEFVAHEPSLILANAHVPAGNAFADLDAVQIDIVNFPGDSLDLIDVFETNAAAIVGAFESL